MFGSRQRYHARTAGKNGSFPKSSERQDLSVYKNRSHPSLVKRLFERHRMAANDALATKKKHLKRHYNQISQEEPVYILPLYAPEFLEDEVDSNELPHVKATFGPLGIVKDEEKKEERKPHGKKKSKSKSLEAAPRIPYAMSNVLSLKPVTSVNAYRAQQRRLAEVREEIDGLKCAKARFETQSSQVRTFGTVDTLTIVNNILGRGPEILSVDADRCEKCNGILTFDQPRNLSVCGICNTVISRLFVAEDSTVDVLILRVGMSGTSAISRSRKQGGNTLVLGNDESKARHLQILGETKDTITMSSTQRPKRKKSTCAPLSENPDRKELQLHAVADHVVKRVGQYKEFLNQFAENRPEIPQKIISLIYRELAPVHLLNSVKCKPTPVCTILRNHALHEFIPMAPLISRTFNGQPTPKFNMDLIGRLQKRLSVLAQVSTETQRKSLGIELLVAVCLRCEGEDDFARAFSLLKTRVVLRTANERLKNVIANAKILEPDLAWPVVWLC